MTWVGDVHVGPYNKLCHIYDGFGNMASYPGLLPNGELQVAKMPMDVQQKKRALILRLKDGSSVIQKVGGSGGGVGAMSQTTVKIDAQQFVGQQVGITVDGTPIYMGAPISESESRAYGGVSYVGAPIDLEPQVAEGTPYMVFSSGNVGATIMIDPITIGLIILAVVIAVGVSGVFITQNLATQAQAQRDREEFIMRTHALDDVAQSTQIESEYDAGNKHFIKYKNGELISIDKTTGVVTIEVQGIDMSQLADDAINTPTGGGTDWGQIAMYGVVGVLILGGAYVVFRYLISPAISKRKESHATGG